MAVKHFEGYLRGRAFTMVTDHRPLLWLLKNAAHSIAVYVRYALYLSQFEFEVEHVAGVSNVLADALSRARQYLTQKTVGTVGSLVGSGKEDDAFEAIARLRLEGVTLPPQLQQEELKSAREDVEKHLSQLQVVGSRLKRGAAYYIPVERRDEILFLAHKAPFAGHLGQEKTLFRLKETCWWPGMKQDVRVYVNACGLCQRLKDRASIAAELRPLEVAAPFERVHLDLVGPLTETPRGNKYILTLTDAGTKYMEAAAIPDKTAATVARAYVSEVITRFGCPRQVVSDQGSEFVNALWNELNSRLGVGMRTTSPYHPEANGQAERQHRTLMAIVRTLQEPSQDDWDLVLRPALFAKNTAVHRGVGETPFFLMFGRKPLTPLAMAVAPLPSVMKRHEWMEKLLKARELAAAQDGLTRGVRGAGAAETSAPLREGDLVLVKFTKTGKGKSKKLAAKQQGPFRVVSVRDGVTARLQSVANEKEQPIERHVKHLVRFEGEVTLDDEYEVEALLSERKRSGVVEYLVKFRGYSHDHDLWIPEKDLHASRLVNKWKREKQKKIRQKLEKDEKVRVSRVADRRATRRKTLYYVATDPDQGPDDYQWLPRAGIENTELLDEFDARTEIGAQTRGGVVVTTAAPATFGSTSPK